MTWIRHRVKAPPAPADWSEPIVSEEDHLLERLYEWERRCRGYALYPSPVMLEPVFVPLREAGVLAVEGSRARALPPATSASRAYLPLAPPPDMKVAVPHSVALIQALSTVRSPVAFEVIGNGREIVFQIAAARGESAEVAAVLGMHFPAWNGATDTRRGSGNPQGQAAEGSNEDVLRASLHGLRHLSLGCRVVDFGLLRFAFQPLQLFTSFAPDPLAGVVAALGQVGDGEVAGLQVLFTSASSQWAPALLQLAEALDDGSAPAWGRGHEAGLSSQARAKLTSPLFACAVRVFALSANEDAAAPPPPLAHGAVPPRGMRRRLHSARKSGEPWAP